MNKYLKYFPLTKSAQNPGFILLSIVILMSIIGLTIIAVSSGAILNHSRANHEFHNTNALMAADAGLDEALIELTADSDWVGSGSEVTLLNTDKMRTTYETVVSSTADPDRKVITATARTYSPGSATEPTVTKRYEIDVEAVTSGTGSASVVSGVGGLVLNNNSKISGGDVLVNGKVTVNNNSQIGLSTNPVNVRVAHQSCPNPPDVTYPRVCNSGEDGQPITIGTTGKIYGEVHATNQTDGTNMFNPGLIAGATYVPTPLPDYDREAQKAAATQVYASTDSTIACGNNETKDWPANIKITGNVTLGNNCTINLAGDVWLADNLTIGSNAEIIVSDTVGTETPVMMVDGSDGIVFGNNARIVPNNVNTGIEAITYWSAASCSPDCTDVTGASLASSQTALTIDLSNNGSAQNSVLYARWSKVRVSNNGALGAIAGQTVELGENAVISFTAAVPGSDNLITTWVKRGYMRVYE